MASSQPPPSWPDEGRKEKDKEKKTRKTRPGKKDKEKTTQRKENHE
jgi:hypothetical protein